MTSWVPEIPEAQRAIRVLSRTVSLEPVLELTLGLSCGHIWKAQLTAFPVVAVTETLGWPEVGDAVDCPTCGRKLPTFYGEISDEAIH